MNSKKIKSSPKGRCRLPLHVYLAYLLVFSLLLTGVSFSSYITTTNAEDSARVAKGIVTVGYTDSTALEIKEKEASHGFGADYFSFEVSNENSEVAIGYDIVVTLDQPLQDDVWLILDSKFVTPTNEGKEYKFTNAGTFKAGEKQLNEHTLGFSVNFDTLPDVGEYVYKINISIDSHQID